MVRNDDIAQVLHERSDSQRACSELVELALKEGGKDNITVIVADVGIEFC